MSVLSEVQAASNVRDGLLAIAAALDRLAPPPTSPTWDEWSGGTVSDDPEDQAAEAARRRLANDSGAAVALGITDTDLRPTVVVSDGGVRVEVARVDKHRTEARRAAAGAYRLPEYLDHLEPEQALDAYAQGGPIWLHAYDRKSVMDMPIPFRQLMVADVEQDNPAAAHELGRDILKSNQGLTLAQQAEYQGHVIA